MLAIPFAESDPLSSQKTEQKAEKQHFGYSGNNINQIHQPNTSTK